MAGKIKKYVQSSFSYSMCIYIFHCFLVSIKISLFPWNLLRFLNFFSPLILILTIFFQIFLPVHVRSNLVPASATDSLARIDGPNVDG